MKLKNVNIEDYKQQPLTGRNRRLLFEWQKLEDQQHRRSDISCRVSRRNAIGLPTAYLIEYHLMSICGVEQIERLGEPSVSNPPIFANNFLMRIDLPPGYPCIDSLPAFKFLVKDEHGDPIPHPWHPNIRFFGDLAGRVCINMTDTYADLAWVVDRIGTYLRYERYHALAEPPYPEDMKVAAWVIRQGEPNEWIFFSQNRQ